MKERNKIPILNEVNHKQLYKIILNSYYTQKPLFIWGKTGIGKSYTVREVAKTLANEFGLEYTEEIKDVDNEKKFCLIDLRISQLDPSDLRGIPMINNSNNKTEWKRPNWFPLTGRGILFLDELNLAPPLTQNAAYQIILDRRSGEYKLSDGYTVIAAGNRSEDSINVHEIAAPLLNRFQHVSLKVPTYKEWESWAVANKIDSRIILFLARNDYLFNYRPESTDPAFPTPRTWHMLSDNIKNIDDFELIEYLAVGAVGQEAGMAFSTFLKFANDKNLPSPEQIINNVDGIKIPAEIDKTYFMIAQYIHYIVNELEATDPKILKKTASKYITILFKLLLRIQTKELLVVAIRYIQSIMLNESKFIVNGKPIINPIMEEFMIQKDGQKLLEKYGRYLIPME